MDPERNFAADWRPRTRNLSILINFDLYLVFQLVPDRDPGIVHGLPSGQVPGLPSTLDPFLDFPSSVGLRGAASGSFFPPEI